MRSLVGKPFTFLALLLSASLSNGHATSHSRHVHIHGHSHHARHGQMHNAAEAVNVASRGQGPSVDNSARALSSSSAPAGLAAAAVDFDPYTCGPGRPCSNGACCGPSGNCGYAPAYCGTGCTSNCDAKAQCGQYAAKPGQTCPLNACCSEFGFCGTTTDFCKPGCQSNCVADPQPPPGSPKNSTMNRIIGYYESWSYRSKCNHKTPSDLPLTELTHLNYAFAFVDPQSYGLVVMDSDTTEDLWQLTVDTKRYNPNLKVFVAVGGWTFSDNGTATQPLLGEIASTEANRQRFADAVVRFLNTYGFDGLDLDWEYPGAPDRGGKPEDTENYTLLMKTLRSTFDGSPRPLGLTFTIPSSYWYLRWFDLPGLLKYADWTNLMSYDLHGTWDRNNPIGAIAQSHTNLTEIKLATQLLWRVGIQPSQVALGYGFYGRSFELADPACSTPGCAFTGGARPGPCSDTSGVLMYYEIQAILEQVPDLKPVFDKEAVAKYLVFDKNQWVSYDDAETFKLKLAWADEIGIGGSMIWAVDTDDSKFSAMSGLVGYPVSHVNTKVDGVNSLSMNKANVGSVLQGENGQGCKALLDASCRPKRDLRCGSGEMLIGWDRDGCSSDEGKPICCPAKTALGKCTWRGTGNDGGIWGDCNGQCHPGESRILWSRWGGGPEKDRESDPYWCARGHKVLCCEANNYKSAIDGCYWTDCDYDNKCKSNEKEIATKKGFCPMSQEPKYCCPNDTPLHDCTWRGTSPDCVDPNCLMEEDGKVLAEVQIDSQSGGDSWNLCSYGRQKGLCCQVSKILPAPLYCDKTTCDIDPMACVQDNFDEWGNPYPNTASLKKRVYVSGLDGRDVDLVMLERRGGKRNFKWVLAGVVIHQVSQTYPTIQRYMANLRNRVPGVSNRHWRIRSRNCGSPRLEDVELDVNGAPPQDTQVEHTIPLVIVGRFAAVAGNGRQWAPRVAGRISESTGQATGQAEPEGPQTRSPIVAAAFWQNVWNNGQGLPANLPPVTPGGAEMRTPAVRIYEALGSNDNAAHFTLLGEAVNSVKGAVEGYRSPMSQVRFERLVRTAVAESGSSANSDIEEFMTALRETRAVFQYVNAYDVVTRLDATASAVLGQLQLIEQNVPEARGLSAHWNEFYPHYFSQVSEFARDWGASMIRHAREQYEANPDAYNRDAVLEELKELEGSIADWKYAFE